MIYTYFYFSHFFYILIKLMVASSHRRTLKFPCTQNIFSLHSEFCWSAL